MQSQIKIVTVRPKRKRYVPSAKRFGRTKPSMSTLAEIRRGGPLEECAFFFHPSHKPIQNFEGVILTVETEAQAIAFCEFFNSAPDGNITETLSWERLAADSPYREAGAISAQGLIDQMMEIRKASK